MLLTPLYLKKHVDHRLRLGHLWIYSNEIDTQKSPLSQFEPGQPVTICNHKNLPLGNGYVNPHSLICARILSRQPTTQLDQTLLVQRLNHALILRQQLFGQPFYRLIFGEGDFLPGLVVDRFGEVIVAQITTAGMERLRADLIAALEQVLQPRAIVLRNDTSVRTLEGLDRYVEVVKGELPDDLTIIENGVRFQVPVLEGQKTGWFYDHRLNRQRLTAYVRTQRVLDVFSYLGAWGIQAAVAGAKEVCCIDSSAKALEYVKHHAQLNNVSNQVHTIQGDAFETLKRLSTEGQSFDVIILDPPALIKRKKDQQAGEQAYRRLNFLAMQLLNPHGILVSASCSWHLSRESLLEFLNAASLQLDRPLQILEEGQQSPDHPVHPAIPETKYLKVIIGRVS